MNPCPCGFLGHPSRACRCSPEQVARYQGKLSGPLLDRIDLHVDVPALPAHDLLAAHPGEPSAVVRARVQAAQLAGRQRQGHPNQRLTGAELQKHAQAEDRALQFLSNAATRLGWSARGVHRTLRVARTIADLAGSPVVTVQHLAEAMQYRPKPNAN